MPEIIQKKENARHCGYRKKGGLYLVSDGLAGACDKLPIPVCKCPTCGMGIKQARGFTWITTKLFADKYCGGACNQCPLSPKNIPMGLMWVGTKFYPNTNEFTKEAMIMGVSKRIARIPQDFVIGETWIALAHPKAIIETAGNNVIATPGIFHAFKPSRIEYVVTGKETEDQLNRLKKRGLTLVNVTRIAQSTEQDIFN
jgi:hypothetical protein